MSRYSPRRLLAVWALTLCPIARAAEIRFAADVPVAVAARQRALADEVWPAWERRLGIEVPRPSLVVALALPEAMAADFGRTRGGRIELHRLLTQEAADSIFRHEIAHVFFEVHCASLSGRAALLSEAFALFVSGDAARRTLEGTRFLYASAARDWLEAHADEAVVDSAAAQQALSRVLAQPDREPALWGFFGRLLASCRGASFSDSGAVSDLFDAVGGTSLRAGSSRTDFLVIDGLSGRTLASDGRPTERYPAGSILKPSLVAAVPALMEPRAERDDIAWHCPGPPSAGALMAWQTALAASCNGFFLDADSGPPRDFREWERELLLSGAAIPDRSLRMEDRIGLRDGITISPLAAVRLYAWLDRKSPFVVDALRATPSSGTLASAPDARWFAQQGIALKTGTVRSAASEPLHAWIVAVGRRQDSGAPAFVAALHATGRATTSLLPELERRLHASLTGLERPASVQILALAAPSGIRLACDGDAPLFARAAGGPWRIEEPGTSIEANEVQPGAAYACPAAALAVRYQDGRGGSKLRLSYGVLSVGTVPPGEEASSVSLREKSARARRGSPWVLTTSERWYAVSSLLSEAPQAHTELLAALALVLRNNRLAGRHGDRPPCDTTHCNLFGWDGDASRAAYRRADAAVARTAPFEIAASEDGRVWLPFFLGGTDPWVETRSRSGVARALALAIEPASLIREADGSFEAAPLARRFPCELLRNQLRLPSCPSSVESLADGFRFSGRGEGHGEGLDLTRAGAAAAEGADFRDILGRAWPDLRVVASSPATTIASGPTAR